MIKVKQNKMNRNHILRLSILFLFLSVTILIAGCQKSVDEDPGMPIIDNRDYTPTRTVTETEVVIYEGPSVLTTSDKVSIEVEGHELFVYETLVNHGRTFTFTSPTTKAPVALFDFEGRVNVTVTVNEEVETAVIRPLAFNVEPVISGNTITFTLEYSANYVIEYNDDPNKAIHLFANPIEEDTPDPDNLPDDMIYIGPGVYKADAIPIESNQTLYIAGGAVVYGQIRAENVENVTIRGRGIIDGSIYHRRSAAEFTIPIEFRHSRNIKIEGITFLDPAGWTISSYFVDGLLIDNIKIITARGNGDGISIQSSQNVLAKNSFVRSWDDSLVVKNYTRGTTENVIFENMVLWTDLAQSMEVGFETYGDTMKDIIFRDITVLHNFHKPVISIHNADDAAISNVVFQNITVENAEIIGDNHGSNHDNFFIDLTVQYNQVWSSSGGVRGSIDNVIIDNVLVLDGRDDFVTRIIGHSSSNAIRNVSLNNITYKGIQARSTEDLRLSSNNHVSNISVNFTMEESTGAQLVLPYKLALSDQDIPNIRVIPTIEQSGFIVPEFAIGELPDVYIGQRVTGNFTAMSTRGTSLLEWNDGSGAFELEGHHASNVLNGDKSVGWIGAEWTNTPGEFAALSIEFNEDKRVGTIRIYGDPESQAYIMQNIAVFGIRSTATNDVYTRILNASNYEFTPANGNYVDIKINPGEFRAIQLRFYERDGQAFADQAFANEIEIYPASLTYNRSVSATPHEDVYVSNHITDGNPLTYYESSKGQWPAEVTIDLASIYDVNYITLSLPPLMQWEPRTQTFSIEASSDGVNFREIVASADYLFDPRTGNIVEIQLENPEEARFLRVIFTDNTRGFGAQISQISAFE